MSAPVQAASSETPTEHLRSALLMLGGLRRALQISGLDAQDAHAMVEGITRRIGLALNQLAHPRRTR